MKRYVVLFCLLFALPVFAQRPAVYSTLVTTDTGVTSLCVGGNDPGAPSTCTGGLKAGAIAGSGNATIGGTLGVTGAVTSSGAIVGVGALTINGMPNAAAGVTFSAVTTGIPTLLLSNATTGTLVGVNATNNKDLQIWTNGNSTLAATFLSNGNWVLPATFKLFLDSGGDSYISEASANTIAFIAGGTQGFGVIAGGGYVSSGSKLWIDGGGDTYAFENGANNYAIVAGGTTSFSVTATGVTAAGTLTANGASTLTGNVSVGSANITDAVATPTISACGTGSPSVTGKDYAFRIVTGTTAASTCTVNFNATYANAPSCSASDGAGTSIQTVGTTTTQFVATRGAGNWAGETMVVLCRGF